MRTDTLHEFVHLSSTLNFTKTASAFGISQPALSNRIAALEAELGFPLFNREDTVSLTEEGRSFLRDVAPLLERLDEAVERCRDIHLRRSRTLVVETVPNNMAVLKAVHGFKCANPDVDVEIADLGGSSILERVQSGKALCGVYLPTTDVEQARETAPDVAFVEFDRAEMLAWVEAEGPLGSAPAIRPADLEGRVLVYPSNLYAPISGDGVRWLARHWGVDFRVEGRYGRSFDEFVLNGVQEGDVYTLLSCFSSISICNVRTDRVWRPFDPPVVIPLYIAYRKDCDDRSLARFIDYLGLTGSSGFESN